MQIALLVHISCIMWHRLSLWHVLFFATNDSRFRSHVRNIYAQKRGFRRGHFCYFVSWAAREMQHAHRPAPLIKTKCRNLRSFSSPSSSFFRPSIYGKHVQLQRLQFARYTLQKGEREKEARLSASNQANIQQDMGVPRKIGLDRRLCPPRPPQSILRF